MEEENRAVHDSDNGGVDLSTVEDGVLRTEDRLFVEIFPLHRKVVGLAFFLGMVSLYHKY